MRICGRVFSALEQNSGATYPTQSVCSKFYISKFKKTLMLPLQTRTPVRTPKSSQPVCFVFFGAQPPSHHNAFVYIMLKRERSWKLHELVCCSCFVFYSGWASKLKLTFQTCVYRQAAPCMANSQNSLHLADKPFRHFLMSSSEYAAPWGLGYTPF